MDLKNGQRVTVWPGTKSEVRGEVVMPVVWVKTDRGGLVAVQPSNLSPIEEEGV